VSLYQLLASFCLILPFYRTTGLLLCQNVVVHYQDCLTQKFLFTNKAIVDSKLRLWRATNDEYFVSIVSQILLVIRKSRIQLLAVPLSPVDPGQLVDILNCILAIHCIMETLMFKLHRFDLCYSKHCDVCLFVYLSVLWHNLKTTPHFTKILYGCCLWPWLSPSPTVLRYAMYFRFCG